MRAGSALTLSLWREYHEEARRLPGMYLGSAAVEEGADAAAVVRGLYEGGARRVELVGLADLSDEADPCRVVRTLDVLRELTAWGIAVDWRARLSAPTDDATRLGHLHPPREIDGPGEAEAARTAWSGSFFLGRCYYRTGPGFLEVRDHRQGFLNRIVLDEPDYLDAVARLSEDAKGRDVPEGILDELVGESLVIPVAGRFWWAPYRVRRWPQPPFLA